MSGGYTGKILEVDLTGRRHFFSDTDRQAAAQFLGGRGMGIKTLWDRIPGPGLDPLSPENPLMFWPGPLSGFPLAGASRVAVVTKSASTSPAKSPVANASTVSYSSIGGHFGPALKQAGYDGLILTGKSDRPVVLVVNEGSVSFRDATDLWGQSATATLTRLNQELGPDFRLLTIGPAGEAGVRFAGIVSDVRRTTARGGAGAVMGSKNLKAIAVRGSLPIPLQNKAGLFALRRELATLLARWSNYEHWRRWGATPLLLSASQAGMLTTKNFREGSWPAVANLSMSVAEREFWVRHTACAHCSLKCVKIGQISNGSWRGVIAEGPGYSAGAMLGANCGVTGFNGLMKLISRADELGLDPIAAGNVLGFVLDLYENGILRPNDLDGLSPTWGNVPVLLELLDRIARRQGIGEVLSRGVKKAAAAIGEAADPFAMHVKGQEMAGWNIPASHDFAIVYGTANRGASHQEGASVPEQHRRTFLDALGICRFVYGAVGTAPYQRALTLATGLPGDDASMLTIGERIWNLEKMFNAREGFRRQDDRLPSRITSLRFTVGPKAGATFPADKQDSLLDKYYADRGWNQQTSLPTPEKLKLLGLDKLVAKG
ncbi:MAG: aldehyde ferredoxin oxidoreductase family protein [Veillonellaceae bacterium]|nr:aldehyde ferredoxin oxidoreductase family protein [Veillonellaceae bacterium]